MKNCILGSGTGIYDEFVPLAWSDHNNPEAKAHFWVKFKTPNPGAQTNDHSEQWYPYR